MALVFHRLRLFLKGCTLRPPPYCSRTPCTTWANWVANASKEKSLTTRALPDFPSCVHILVSFATISIAFANSAAGSSHQRHKKEATKRELRHRCRCNEVWCTRAQRVGRSSKQHQRAPYTTTRSNCWFVLYGPAAVGSHKNPVCPTTAFPADGLWNVRRYPPITSTTHTHVSITMHLQCHAVSTSSVGRTLVSCGVVPLHHPRACCKQRVNTVLHQQPPREPDGQRAIAPHVHLLY